jgi:hypothetical protein
MKPIAALRFIKLVNPLMYAFHLLPYINSWFLKSQNQPIYGKARSGNLNKSAKV